MAVKVRIVRRPLSTRLLVAIPIVASAGAAVGTILTKAIAVKTLVITPGGG